MRTKIITLAIVALATVCSLQAQDAVKPTQDPAVQRDRAEQRELRREKTSERTAAELGLTEEQTAKLKEIEREYTASMEALRATGDREKLSVEGRKLGEQREAQLKELLTDEQYNKMVQIRRGNNVSRDRQVKERKAE